MFNWLRELLEIKAQYRERKIEYKACESCEILKTALERSNYEREKLLNVLLKRDDPIVEAPAAEPEPLKPRHIPWRIRQQQLEADDRKQAEKMKALAIQEEFVNQLNKLNTAELEKSMGLGEKNVAL